VADALEYEWYIDRTVAETDRLAWVADGADPAHPVPSCPGWTMAKLIKHSGTVHRWAREIIARRSGDRVDVRTLDLGLPAKESDYAGWLAAGAEPLADALREAGPDARAWTWSGDRTTRWWARRMLHETAVHRADAELASGIAPELDPVTAADGISELLAVLPAAPRAAANLASLPAGQSLHLHATDCECEWLIRFTGDGIACEPGHARAAAAVRGPAGPLLLFACGRIPPADPRLDVRGEERLLSAWQEKATL
jgi:uncharacterized protein (TIGR03083 family)